MPWLDVSEVLTDAFLIDSIVVVRRLQTVNSLGVAETTIIHNYTVSGVVTPTGNNSLVRQEAFESQAKTIQVITQFALRGAGKDRDQGNNWLPDIICWNGDSYIVSSLNDFSRFGTGFLVAECTAIDYDVAAVKSPV